MPILDNTIDRFTTDLIKGDHPLHLFTIASHQLYQESKWVIQHDEKTMKKGSYGHYNYLKYVDDEIEMLLQCIWNTLKIKNIYGRYPVDKLYDIALRMEDNDILNDPIKLKQYYDNNLY